MNPGSTRNGTSTRDTMLDSTDERSVGCRLDGFVSGEFVVLGRTGVPRTDSTPVETGDATVDFVGVVSEHASEARRHEPPAVQAPSR